MGSGSDLLSVQFQVSMLNWLLFYANGCDCLFVYCLLTFTFESQSAAPGLLEVVLAGLNRALDLLASLLAFVVESGGFRENNLGHAVLYRAGFTR